MHFPGVGKTLPGFARPSGSNASFTRRMTAMSTAEYWSGATSGYTASVNMLEPRIGTIAVRLKNGQVAVIGGSTGGKDDMLGYDGTPTPTIEIYSK